jgi:hypothetical protein
VECIGDVRPGWEGGAVHARLRRRAVAAGVLFVGLTLAAAWSPAAGQDDGPLLAPTRHEQTLASCVATLARTYGLSDHASIDGDAVIRDAIIWFPADDQGGTSPDPILPVARAGQLLRLYGVPICSFRPDDTPESSPGNGGATFPAALAGYLRNGTPVLLDLYSGTSNMALLAVHFTEVDRDTTWELADPVNSGSISARLVPAPGNALLYKFTGTDGVEYWIRSAIAVPLESKVTTSNWGDTRVSTLGSRVLPEGVPMPAAHRAAAPYLPATDRRDLAYVWRQVPGIPGTGAFLSPTLDRCLATHRLVPAKDLTSDFMRQIGALSCDVSRLIPPQNVGRAVELLNLLSAAKWAESQLGASGDNLATLGPRDEEDARAFRSQLGPPSPMPSRQEQFKLALVYSLAGSYAAGTPGLLQPIELLTRNSIQKAAFKTLAARWAVHAPLNAATTETFGDMLQRLAEKAYIEAAGGASNAAPWGKSIEFGLQTKQSWLDFQQVMDHSFSIKVLAIRTNGDVVKMAGGLASSVALDQAFLAYAATRQFGGFLPWAEGALASVRPYVTDADLASAMDEILADIRSKRDAWQIGADTYFGSGEFMSTLQTQAAVDVIVAMASPAIAALVPVPVIGQAAVALLVGLTLKTWLNEDLTAGIWLDRAVSCIAGTQEMNRLVYGTIRPAVLGLNATYADVKAYENGVTIHAMCIRGFYACFCQGYRVVEYRNSEWMCQAADSYDFQANLIREKIDQFREPAICAAAASYWLGDGAVQCQCGYSFPPQVLWTEPAAEAGDASVNTTVQVGFDCAMDPATITGTTFRLQQGGDSIAAAVGLLEDGRTAWLKPGQALGDGVRYGATVGAGVSSLAHVPMGRDHQWSFVTTSKAGRSWNTYSVQGPLWSSLGNSAPGLWCMGATFREDTGIGWNALVLRADAEGDGRLYFVGAHYLTMLVGHAPVDYYTGNSVESGEMTLYALAGLNRLSLADPAARRWRRIPACSGYRRDVGRTEDTWVRPVVGLGSVVVGHHRMMGSTVEFIPATGTDWSYLLNAFSGYGLAPAADLVLLFNLVDCPEWTHWGIGAGVQVGF